MYNINDQFDCIINMLKNIRLILRQSLVQRKSYELSLMKQKTDFRDKFNKSLNMRISESKNEQQLQTIYKSNQTDLNFYHITAILKKMNKLNTHPKENFKKQVFDSAQNVLKSQFIKGQIVKIDGIRGLSNIICYAGNLKYTKIKSLLTKLDYECILPYTNPKQFVMLITGLLKLQILDQCFEKKNKSIKGILIQSIGQKYHNGLLISLWRNIIKAKKTDQELDLYFCEKVVVNKLSDINLKDYGYLVYCYTESFKNKDIPITNQLLSQLKTYPQKVLYSSRINIYELCFLIDNLIALRNQVSFELNPHFSELIKNHYYRNITVKNLSLRNLANGFNSMIILFQTPETMIYQQTKKQFINLLQQINGPLKDFESVISLFVQLTKLAQQQSLSEYESYEDQQLVDLITLVHDLLSGCSLTFENRLLQKLLYGIYLHKKYNKNYEMPQQLKRKLTEEVKKRNFEQKQIQSILFFLKELKKNTKEGKESAQPPPQNQFEQSLLFTPKESK